MALVVSYFESNLKSTNRFYALVADYCFVFASHDTKKYYVKTARGLHRRVSGLHIVRYGYMVSCLSSLT
jgi:hypothetical protein